MKKGLYVLTGTLSVRVKTNPQHVKVYLTPKFFFGRDETVQHSHKEFDNSISIW